MSARLHDKQQDREVARRLRRRPSYRVCVPTSPGQLCLVVVSRFLLPTTVLLLLASIPLLRFLITNEYESPFTEPDETRLLPSNISFLLEPSTCSSSHNMLIVIVSRPAEFQLRRKIRATWAHRNVYETNRTRIVFLVGRADSQDEETLLLKENVRFDDVVIADIEESYYNLSVKTYALLEYKQLRCRHASCLVKADSDNVLNLRNYEAMCKANDDAVIVGECDVSRRVLRSGSKWAVPFSVYPLPRYPQYCSTGTYFMLGRNTAEALNTAARNSKFFYSSNMRMLPEDVLFTGIFAELGDIKRRSIEGLSFFGRPNYGCVNGTYRAFSLHMDQDKEPAHYFTVLNLFEGLKC